MNTLSNDWKETRMGKDHCPRCGRMCDAASDPHGQHAPRPGDISICAYCAAILQFADDMELRQCPPHVLEQMDERTLSDIRRYRAAILDLKNIRS